MEAIVTLASTGFGAFFGAWCAFRFEERVRLRQERTSHVAAGNQALFRIQSQASRLISVRKQQLDKYRDVENRWIRLPQTAPLSTVHRLDIESLSFMLKIGGSDILNDILVAEDTYQEALAAISMRFDWYGRLLEKADVSRLPTESGLEVAQDVLGPLIVGHVQGVTDRVYEQVDKAIDRKLATFEQLRSFLKSRFPQEKFLQIVPPNPSAASPTDEQPQ